MCEIQDNWHRETDNWGEAVLSQGQTDHRKTKLMTIETVKIMISDKQMNK